MQWHKITEKGSYAISTYGTSKVKYEIYEKHDLSRPMKQYPGKPYLYYASVAHAIPLNVPKYAMPDPPYYIRVYSPDRTWTGDYNIIIHKLGCTSANDSCLLEPTIKAPPYKWPAKPVNQDDTIWYTFMTDVGFKGDFPLLNFYLKMPRLDPLDTVFTVANSKWAFEIVNTDPPYPPVSPDPLKNMELMSSATLLSAEVNTLKGAGSSPAVSLAKEYYLKVRRQNQTPLTVQTTTAYYYTQLTYLHAKGMTCKVQDDNIGKDDIWYKLDIDGDGYPWKWTDNQYWSYLGEFVTDGKSMTTNTDLFNHSHKYVKQLIVNLMDDDDPGSNDYLEPGPSYYAQCDPIESCLSDYQIKPLDANTKSQDGTFSWHVGGTFWYEFEYNLSHTPPKK